MSSFVLEVYLALEFSRFEQKFTQTDSHFLIETYLAGTNQPVTKNRNPGENMLFIELFESMNILR